VSSSAHLVAAQRLCGIDAPGIHLEVALHFGTLLAILHVFRRDLLAVLRDGVAGTAARLGLARDPAAKARAALFPTAVAIAVGTVPIVLAGLLLGRQVARAFDSVRACGSLLVVTGIVLAASRLAPPGGTEAVGVLRGALVGVAQAFALLPGISRSGVTIAAGRLLRVERRAAARYSFLLAVPALAAASVWEVAQEVLAHSGHPAATPVPGAAALALGAVSAAIVGTLCLRLLLRVVDHGHLHWFAAYCVPAGVLMAALG
jgi:undecaprenyl-diphosphatase